MKSTIKNEVVYTIHEWKIRIIILKENKWSDSLINIWYGKVSLWLGTINDGLCFRSCFVHDQWYRLHHLHEILFYLFIIARRNNTSISLIIIHWLIEIIILTIAISYITSHNCILYNCFCRSIFLSTGTLLCKSKRSNNN